MIVILLFLLGINSGEEANTNKYTRITFPIADLEDEQTVDGFLPVHGIPKSLP